MRCAAIAPMAAPAVVDYFADGNLRRTGIDQNAAPDAPESVVATAEKNASGTQILDNMPRVTTSSPLRGSRPASSRGGFDLDRGEPSGREGSEGAGSNYDVRKERDGGFTESDRPESGGKSHPSGKSSPAAAADNAGRGRHRDAVPANNEHLSEENDDYEPEDRHSQQEDRRVIPPRDEEAAGRRRHKH